MIGLSHSVDITRCLSPPSCLVIASPHSCSQFPGGGVLYIFWVRGRAIGKGINFHEFAIRNGIDFHDFGIRNGIDFCNFRNWYRVGYAFSENWYKVGYIHIFEKLV